MKCLVCMATWDDAQGTRCPQCRFDMAAPDALDPTVLERARRAFRETTTAYAPQTRVSRWDVVRPWVGLGLGFLLFVLWLRACATSGFLR